MNKFFLALMSISFILLLTVFVFAHENTHVEINSMAGVESKYVFASPLYIGVSAIGQPINDISNYELAHITTEIVGYNAFFITILLFFICLGIWYPKFNKNVAGDSQ